MNVRVVLLLVLVAACTDVPKAPASPEDLASEEHRAVAIFEQFEPSEIGPFVVAVLDSKRVSVSEPRSERSWGGLALRDADGFRHTVTWYFMPPVDEGSTTTLIMLSYEPGASSDVIDSVEESLRAVDDERRSKLPVLPCLYFDRSADANPRAMSGSSPK